MLSTPKASPGFRTKSQILSFIAADDLHEKQFELTLSNLDETLASFVMQVLQTVGMLSRFPSGSNISIGIRPHTHWRLCSSIPKKILEINASFESSAWGLASFDVSERLGLRKQASSRGRRICGTSSLWYDTFNWYVGFRMYGSAAWTNQSWNNVSV